MWTNDCHLYYQPNIREFSVGLEYQYLQMGKWNDTEFTMDELSTMDEWVDVALKEGNIRVRKICQEDIEKAGWEFRRKSIDNNLEFRIGDESLVFYPSAFGKKNVRIFGIGCRPMYRVRNLLELKKLMKFKSIHVK